MPNMTGRVIAGRYNLEHPIGRGAMGVVWRARDQLLDRDVAVKEVVITALISAEERHNAYQRTLREAKTAARLSHRGVVAVYDVAEEDGRPWIVMELVPSRSLDQVLTAEGRLSLARTGRIGQQLLSALAAAHAAGVLHRDVKPSNVLIANDRAGDAWDERAVLTDFGIAQFEGDPRLTQTGMVMGSPGFTAPERIRGGDATPASDLWSLGATLYAAVEGRGPYESRGGAITTMSAIINEDAPTAPHAGRLGPLIAGLLRRDPTTRPSASAAARMFAQLLPRLADPAELPGAAHPPTVRAAFPPSAGSPADAGPAEPGKADAGEVAGPADDDLAPDANEAAGEPLQPKPDEAGARKAVPAEVTPVGVTVAESALPEAPADDAADAAPKEPAGGRLPPKVEVPVARGEITVPAEPKPAQPKPTPPKPTPPKPVKPKPTFTAAKAEARVAPTFSAASPVRPPQPARPYVPRPDTGYQGDSTTPLQPPGGQYPGPSPQYPDLSQQYTPGRGGRRSRRGRRRWIAWLAALIVLGAAIGVGTWLGLKSGNQNTDAPSANTGFIQDTKTDFKSVNALNSPTSQVTPGWKTYSVNPGDTKTTAGFSVALPAGFTETRKGLSTFFNGPNHMRMQIDLTPHASPNMVTEADHFSAAGPKGFPGYHLNKVASVPVLHTNGAVWQFTWSKPSLLVDDILFIYPTAGGGSQSYAILIQGPASNWGKTYLPQFDAILSTFQVVQAS